ncbi:hypothetical protein [Planomonospora sp. ID82291]|uniref:hypothetical protein n=1 Tax=Planomonospora sp. ID82291 TaxID=2738136 RepID=UPI0018C405EE|nr:hypothetical protein [Planomonospora sp. ID82291]MBG0818705.1 hypothetical protein [Planomonospora sp. ID82291]
MVHRSPVIPEAWLRAGRSLLQNVVSVAVVAGGPALAAAGDGADFKTLSLSGGSAALAAVLAYVHNLVRPAGAGEVGQVRLRADRSLGQNLVSAAVVAGGAAVASAGSVDLKVLGTLAAQAALAAVFSGLYNVVRPLKPAGGEGSNSAAA